MEVEINPDSFKQDTEFNHSESIFSSIDDIIAHLIANDSILFKNQQRDESDLTSEEKTGIAKAVFDKSKALFLVRFGKYLKQNHLNFFRQYGKETNTDGYEVKVLLQNLTTFHSKADGFHLETKNRRYEALKHLIKENSYFTETEMMKRNPLLYQQLVGQYLSKEEKWERDRTEENNTLVKILLEGIERDEADNKMKLQEEEENNAMEEDEEDSDGGDENASSPSHVSARPSTSRWGEFVDMKDDTIRKNTLISKKQVFITLEERRLLKHEFITLMYQSFLDGKDDFDYASIDNNDDYDNIEILAHDEEDRYFDSEEPEDLRMEDGNGVDESSEDELDIYMNALNQHPSVCKLSKDLERL